MDCVLVLREGSMSICGVCVYSFLCLFHMFTSDSVCVCVRMHGYVTLYPLLVSPQSGWEHSVYA